ncbi:hypothetical protein B484DRAFT_310462, partial [Ochromonadaceae sp. CCMP2298]
IIATAPVSVTSVQYSSDQRIKQNIRSIDEDVILQKFKTLKLRSYEYTDEWANVRG